MNIINHKNLPDTYFMDFELDGYTYTVQKRYYKKDGSSGYGHDGTTELIWYYNKQEVADTELIKKLNRLHQFNR